MGRVSTVATVTRPLLFEKKARMSAGATQHLQGLVARKSASAEPATHAQYFNHVADLVRVNDDFTTLRCACPFLSLLSPLDDWLAIDSPCSCLLDCCLLCRTHNLKRRRQVAYFGYEAVLNRKKRNTIRYRL